MGDGISNAINYGKYDGLTALLGNEHKAKLFNAEHITLAIQKYGQPHTEPKQYDEADDHNITEGEQHTTTPERTNKALAVLLDDKYVRKLYFNSDSISQAIDAKNTDAINLFLDRKQYVRFKASHISEIIQQGDDITMLVPLLRDKELSIFGPEHITEAIKWDRSTLLSALSSKNRVNTDKFITVKHAQEAIDEYKKKNPSALSVLLDQKTQLFASLFTQENKQIPIDCIGYAIENKKNAALELILTDKPKLVDAMHLSIAIHSGNSQGLESILQKKPQLLTPEHITEATRLGNTDIINILCTTCFKIDEKNKRAHKTINIAQTKDRTLHQLAEYITTHEDHPKGLFDIMEGLIAAGANSNTRLRNQNGGSSSAISIVKKLITDEPLKNKIVLLDSPIYKLSKKMEQQAPRSLLNRLRNFITKTLPILGDRLQIPDYKQSYRVTTDAMTEKQGTQGTDRGIDTQDIESSIKQATFQAKPVQEHKMQNVEIGEIEGRSNPQLRKMVKHTAPIAIAEILIKEVLKIDWKKAMPVSSDNQASDISADPTNDIEINNTMKQVINDADIVRPMDPDIKPHSNQPVSGEKITAAMTGKNESKAAIASPAA